DDHFLLSGVVDDGEGSIYVLSSTDYTYGEPVSEHIYVDNRKNTITMSDIVDRVIFRDDIDLSYTTTEITRFVFKGNRFDAVKERTYPIPEL
ncbi:MAG TPA: hypothetical protein PKK43_11545, partial [Spirochaetota bacterium]|nr:hypothetical protein [Spirochaetota bacterium]